MQTRITNPMKVLLLLLMMANIDLSAQTVEFRYDASGNRTARDVIYLQSTSTDSTNAKKAEVFNDLLGVTKITISPNPNGGRFSVKIENYDLESPAQLFLYSINGTMIYETQKLSMLNEIDISKRENGAYILSLIIGDTKKTWIIIKQ